MGENGPVSTNENYMDLKNDAEALLLLLNKYVKVQLIMNTSFDGFIHSIDPITHSVILSVPQDNSYQTTIIPGHAILNMTELETETKAPSRRVLLQEPHEEILLRKRRLSAWFEWNLLPVSECNENIVVKNVSVLPPYSVTDIYAENPVVAMQIKKIMEQMPQDFKTKDL